MIEVYTKKECSYCDDIKVWLKQEKINFKEKPIEDKKYLKELINKQVSAIPHTVICGKTEVTGFNDNVKKIINKNLK